MCYYIAVLLFLIAGLFAWFHCYSCFIFAGERQYLKPDAVPSVFPQRNKLPPSPRKRAREDRASEREEKKRKIEEDNKQESMLAIQDVANEETVGVEDREELTEQKTENTSCTQSIQCELLTDLTSRWRIDMYEGNNKAIRYYTGFKNMEHFDFVFNLLGPAAYDLNVKCHLLSPRDQFFLALIKLRQAKEDYELSLNFNISESLVSRLFSTWLNFMYFQFQEVDIWPARKVVSQHMPSGFRNMFPKTRVILDATEIPIMKPSNVNAQCETYSTYKNRNTLKAMIGITPMGAVSHVSDCYGGSASDRQIIERSDLVDNGKFAKKDAIMADRGIMVQDLFAMKDVQVNTPTMLKGKTQLSAETVVRDRRISSKRIHVERQIGNAKTYKVLTHPLPATKINMGSKIMYVCFFLSNLRKCIVSRWA